MKKIERAYAKINLSLDVRGLRPDGFHEIESLMHLTRLYDVVTLEDSADGELHLSSNASFLPLDGKNICYQAVQAFFREFSLPQRGFSIHIQKRIPVSAGLGGGSADGAAVLRLLAREYRVTDRERLLRAAASVGSDVPFCTVGGGAVCRGRGEQMTPCQPSPRTVFLVIAKNCAGLSTPQIYSLYDALENPPPHGTLSSCTEALAKGDGKALAEAMFNSLEAASLPQRPAIGELKEAMLRLGAYGSMMSGSGPSVFGIFPDEERAKACVRALRKEKVTAFFTCLMNKPLL